MERLSAINSKWTEKDEVLATELINEGFEYIERKDFGTVCAFDFKNSDIKRKNCTMIEIEEFGKLKPKEIVNLRDIING